MNIIIIITIISMINITSMSTSMSTSTSTSTGITTAATTAAVVSTPDSSLTMHHS